MDEAPSTSPAGRLTDAPGIFFRCRHIKRIQFLAKPLLHWGCLKPTKSVKTIVSAGRAFVRSTDEGKKETKELPPLPGCLPGEKNVFGRGGYSGDTDGAGTVGCSKREVAQERSTTGGNEMESDHRSVARSVGVVPNSQERRRRGGHLRKLMAEVRDRLLDKSIIESLPPLVATV